VRRMAAASAGNMRSAEAAVAIAAAVKVERDPDVKEQQVKTLGKIGRPEVRETLAEISRQPGRIGVHAGGALIAIGDPTGMATLEAAIASPQVELRLAAVQAASAAKNPIVIPTLKIGVLDRVFDVRFTAAEGLSIFKAEEALAVPVLTGALESKDSSVVGRALASLIRFGKTLIAKVQRPEDMLDSTDPEQRLATVPVVRELPLDEGVPLLRRLVADPDRDVREAGVEAIGSLTTRAPAQAIELYKPLVHDADPVVRAKASGQLARLLPPLRPPLDPLLEVKKARDEAAAAAAEARGWDEDFKSLAGAIAMKIAAPDPEEAVIKQVQELAPTLDEAAAKLAAAAAKAEIASQTASDAAGPSPSPDAVKLADEAKVLARGALDAASAARDQRADLAEKARIVSTLDVQVLLDGAAASMATGNLPEAKQQLDRAASLLRSSKAKPPALDYAYAQLHDRMSARTQDPEAKRQLLQQAAEAYQRFVKTGAGPRIGLANIRLEEIADELKDLGQSGSTAQMQPVQGAP
jgi:HEAT repeat protein